MQVELALLVPYHGGPATGEMPWPTPPRLYDSEVGRASMEHALAEATAAADAGFASVNFAEHHYSPAQLSPNPIIYATSIGQQLPNINISVLGTDLPLNNPIRIAEEYAMLDNLLDGRLLRIGLLRGTPNEYLTYGTNPWEARESFEEAVVLLRNALIQPEPFGWEGRHYRFRNISVWPQLVGGRQPRLLLSGNSAASARFAGRMKADIGFTFITPEAIAENLKTYREGAAEVGWEPTEDNILYRNYCVLAETAQEAERFHAALGQTLGGLFAGATPDLGAAMAQIGAAMGGVPKGATIDPAKAPKFTMGAPFIGTPDAVLDQLVRTHELIGNGRIEFGLDLPILPDGREVALRTIKLLGEHIVPTLKDLSLVSATESVS